MIVGCYPRHGACCGFLRPGGPCRDGAGFGDVAGRVFGAFPGPSWAAGADWRGLWIVSGQAAAAGG